MKAPFGNPAINSKAIWIGGTAVAVIGSGVFWVPALFPPNPIDQPFIAQQKSRASGFTMKGEAIFQKDAKSGRMQLNARMFATGPMHSDEVIRMEADFTLITPNGREQSLGPVSWTFADDLKGVLPIAVIPAGSKVKIKGTVHVYHREEIKSEREMMSDGSVKLYMNTGTVTFRQIAKSVPPQLEVECAELGSVHTHALELMGLDKKTVSNRILLMPGRQKIERENLPYLGRKIGMEPYIIRQLIPKRKEPVVLVIPVQNTVP